MWYLDPIWLVACVIDGDTSKWLAECSIWVPVFLPLFIAMDAGVSLLCCLWWNWHVCARWRFRWWLLLGCVCACGIGVYWGWGIVEMRWTASWLSVAIVSCGVPGSMQVMAIYSRLLPVLFRINNEIISKFEACCPFLLRGRSKKTCKERKTCTFRLIILFLYIISPISQLVCKVL